MNRRVLFAVAICSFFACIVCSNQSLAIEPDANAVFIYGSPGTIQVNCNGTYQTSMCTPNSASISSIQFRPQIAMPIDNGSYWVELYITFSSNGTSDAPLVVNTPKSITDGTIATFESVSSTTRGTTTVRIYRLVYKYSGSNTYYGPYTISSNSAWVNSAGYLVTSVTLYKENSNTDASNSDIIASINSQSSTLNSINSGISDLRSAQEQANDDANDRYEDEKQTIQDNGDQAQDDMDDFTSSASFSLGNPIAGIFNYFVDTCTVQIPTISSWLGSTETSVTSWWCKTQKLQTIRTTVTTILSFTGVLLTFGFLIRWLRTNQGEA